MRVVGICGSYRKLGNTEILVKEALDATNAETEFIRLTDYTLEPCKGCMACVFKGEECRIQDDMSSLLQLLSVSDSLILGAPTYLLSPPGIVKLFLDRFFMAQPLCRGKKACTIGVAALPRWEPLLLPMLNMVVLSFGYDLLDSCTFYAAGPGEVLLNRDDVERARKMGERLVRGETYVTEGACPVCRATFVSLEQMQCPICGLPISVEKGKVVYHPPTHHRFTEEGWREHLENWILRTEGRYFEHVEEINTLRKKYQK